MFKTYQHAYVGSTFYLQSGEIARFPYTCKSAEEEQEFEGAIAAANGNSMISEFVPPVPAPVEEVKAEEVKEEVKSDPKDAAV